MLQYPPGTGFILSLFPAGFRVIPLYILTSVIAVGFSLFALAYASTFYPLMLIAAFGDSAIYLMINPTKASYSVAPTMMVCALVGFLTAKLFTVGTRYRLLLWALVGLLIGISVNFRLPNLFLAAGYCLYLAGAFLLARSRETFLQGASFGRVFAQPAGHGSNAARPAMVKDAIAERPCAPAIHEAKVCAFPARPAITA